MRPVCGRLLAAGVCGRLASLPSGAARSKGGGLECSACMGLLLPCSGRSGRPLGSGESKVIRSGIARGTCSGGGACPPLSTANALGPLNELVRECGGVAVWACRCFLVCMSKHVAASTPSPHQGAWSSHRPVQTVRCAQGCASGRR